MLGIWGGGGLGLSWKGRGLLDSLIHPPLSLSRGRSINQQIFLSTRVYFDDSNANGLGCEISAVV